MLCLRAKMIVVCSLLTSGCLELAADESPGNYLIFEPTSPGSWGAGCEPSQVRQSVTQLEEFLHEKLEKELAEISILSELQSEEVAIIKKAVSHDQNYLVVLFRQRTEEELRGDQPSTKWDVFNPILWRPVLNGSNLASKVTRQLLNKEQIHTVKLHYAERIRKPLRDASIEDQDIDHLVTELADSCEDPFALNCQPLSELLDMLLGIESVNASVERHIDEARSVATKSERNQLRRWDFQRSGIANVALRRRGIEFGGYSKRDKH